MDARSGEVLHSRNADKRLHPASLTKMMTLYIAFEAVRNGEISLDTEVTVSRNAASEEPSKLGLKTGQKIKLRYLIRAAAIKSANDAATAIGEAISGSEAAFAKRMTRTAKALGMNNTTFRNAHGLTASGHLSTARDMTNLGRHLLFDYNEYYHLFGRTQINVPGRTLYNTNRRLLGNYKGADGIKTGYTRAAGFNLVASAEKGNERIIATIFGGRSSASRNAKMAELLDLGFKRSPNMVATVAPQRPAYLGKVAGVTRSSGKTIRLMTAVTRSLRPNARPVSHPVVLAAIAQQVAQHPAPDLPPQVAEAIVTPPETLPAATVTAQTAPTPGDTQAQAAAVQVALASADVTPVARPSTLMDQFPTALPAEEQPPVREVVTRISTSGGRHWGINVGRYTSQDRAQRVLLKTALNEIETLDGALRKVSRKPTGFDANFMGLSREMADLACRRLQARNQTCFMIGPGT
ncbi:D-alanyl-D-alanine carboxypeptidase family protein [Pseudooceanicola aestuarii]|uniref:D-alanyl-D-alanine carboxypeptidase family protein n=1 Tax=Pseudooceanicola aestuarii TaxID=2697319 RepID=UPI003B82CD8E